MVMVPVLVIGGLPRTCGDEPMLWTDLMHEVDVCPAPAGMSPEPAGNAPNLESLPRTCGDEPLSSFKNPQAKRSAPHLRG